MEMYMIFDNDKPEKTQFKYELGEFITVNSTIPAKCVKIEEIDGKLYQYFKLGKVNYKFD